MIVLALNSVQRRVLGVLIEKSFTTPEQYPLTVNAIVVGCNQKSNRDPVVDFSEHHVVNAVQELTRMTLVRQADSAAGARAVRFEHRVPSVCGWSAREQAVLTELLLRGPQTVGELRTRADRMVKMPDLAYVQGILDELTGRDAPLVTRLTREPGKSAVRYAHTLAGNDEPSPSAPVASPPHPGVADGHVSAQSRSHTDTIGINQTEAPTADALNDLSRRVNDLESRIAALEDAINQLRG